MTENNFDNAAQSWDAGQYRHERARKVAEEILSTAALSISSAVLDFGCGTGLLGFNFINHVKSVTFADTSAGMLEVVNEKIKAGNISNASALLLQDGCPLSGEKFDCIVSLLALHHVSDYKGCLNSLAHALNPGGFLAIADLDKEDGSFHNGDTSVHRGFSREEIKNIFADNGLTGIAGSTPFVMTKDTPAGVKDFPLFLITGRLEAVGR